MEVQGLPWGDPEQAHVLPEQAPEEVPLDLNPILHPDTPHVEINPSFTPAQIQQIGQAYGHLLDWHNICIYLRCPSQADLLHHVCTTTKWRKAPLGQSKTAPPSFIASYLSKGGMCGPLGSNLALATINLVASGKHSLVQKL